MALKAKAYICWVIGMGFLVLSTELFRWESLEPARFLCYFLLATVASGLKVKLPAVTGTMSVNFPIILIGIAELSRPETLLLGCAATLVQCLWRPKERPQLTQVLFSVASIAIAVAITDQVYRSSGLRQQGSVLR